MQLHHFEGNYTVIPSCCRIRLATLLPEVDKTFSESAHPMGPGLVSLDSIDIFIEPLMDWTERDEKCWIYLIDSYHRLVPCGFMDASTIPRDVSETNYDQEVTEVLIGSKKQIAIWPKFFIRMVQDVTIETTQYKFCFQVIPDSASEREAELTPNLDLIIDFKRKAQEVSYHLFVCKEFILHFLWPDLYKQLCDLMYPKMKFKVLFHWRYF